MSKYNFYNKISCAKFFNCDNDAQLQKAILNEFDKLSNMEERQEFTQCIRNAGINIHNLNSTKSYTKHDNEELTYQEAEQRLRAFANMFDQEQDKLEKMTGYEKDLYQNKPEEYELYKLVNDGMDLYESEKGRTTHTYTYEEKSKEYAERMNNYHEMREQARQERKARAESQEKSKVSIDEIWKNID